MTDENENISADDVLKYLKEHYGITKDDLIWWRNYHRSIQKYGDWIAKVIVTSVTLSVISAMGFVIIEGVKHILKLKF